eukprot:COSAG05_NODE_13190_length_439_cov_0.461765_1_plen_133_part_01
MRSGSTARARRKADAAAAELAKQEKQRKAKSKKKASVSRLEHMSKMAHDRDERVSHQKMLLEEERARKLEEEMLPWHQREEYKRSQIRNAKMRGPVGTVVAASTLTERMDMWQVQRDDKVAKAQVKHRAGTVH